jgi:hypothetical protein
MATENTSTSKRVRIPITDDFNGLVGELLLALLALQDAQKRLNEARRNTPSIWRAGR